MIRHAKSVHRGVRQLENQTTQTKTCKRKVSSNVAKQAGSGSVKANLVKNCVKRRKCAADSAPAKTAKTCTHNVSSEPASVSANAIIVKNREKQRKRAIDTPPFSCTTCGRRFRSRHAVYAHQRAHVHARSKAKCTAVVSTQRRERVNNSFRQRPFKSKSNAVSAEDVEEAHNGFESEETADEPSKAKTPDPPNDGCVNVVDRDLEEDDDIQFVEATPGEHLRCAPVPSTKIPDASSVEGKKMPPVTSATNQTSTLPMSTLTAAATEQMARVLEALNDEEIIQLDLDGVLEENIERSPIKRPVKLEAILRTHRKRGTPSVGTISPSASVRNFGKADFSPDGMLAFFTDVNGTAYAFELLDTIRQSFGVRIYRCRACVQTASRLEMAVDLPRVKTVNGYFVDIDPARPQGMCCALKSQRRIKT